MDNLEFNIQTFGCKVNTYDTGLLQERLKKDGFSSSQTPRIHILNTCAVTAEATKDAVRTVRKIKSKDPTATVVVTGCAAQVDTDQFANLIGADLVVANSHKGDIEDLIRKHLNGELTQKVFHSNIFRKEDLEEGGGIEEQHTRTFLKIQDGCNSFCTFCIIPFARGKSRSISVKNLTERVQEFSWNGANEIVLTGVHIGDYEDESNNKLEDLVEAILKNTKIPRIRLSSLEPIEISDRLLELYSDERMCPHFHMSIQSANTKVLSDMRRKYTSQNVELALNKIAKIPDVFVGMDVIAGFAGETDEEFQDTYTRLQNLPWTRIHVFPYSERPGTKALKLTPVPIPIRKQRAEKLRELSSERYAQRALDQIGKIKSVLVLKDSQSLSRDYWPVDLSPITTKPSSEIQVKITGYDYSLKSRMDGYLRGIPLDALS